MPINLEFGKIQLTGEPARQPSEARRDLEGSVRIGIIGDFAAQEFGRAIDRPRNAREPRVTPIDRDNLDAVLARLAPELSITLPAARETPIVLAFREVDDFHPDQLLARAEVFNALRQARGRLEDPSTFAEAAAEIGLGSRSAETAPAPPSPSPPPPPAPSAQMPAAELLNLIVQKRAPSASTPASAPALPATQSGAWSAFLEKITAPHVRRDNPRQAELIAGIDAAMAQLLRDILHHPDFQALESLWRGVSFLTRRLETGADLTLELIDLPRAALEADLLSTNRLDATATYKLLVESSVGIQGGRPWSFLIGAFTFGPARRDVALLWRLGQLARLAGAPFLAAAGSAMVGCESLAATPDPDDWPTFPADQGWSDLRKSAEAPYLGLVLPRFLSRMPYGGSGSSIETFAFEEFDKPPAHEDYLWGNPTFALAALLGNAFDDQGRFDSNRFTADLTDLPLAFETNGEGDTRAKPCAEILLSTRGAEQLLDVGLMPFQSFRDRGAIRLAQLVSIADPPAPLAFR